MAAAGDRLFHNTAGREPKQGKSMQQPEQVYLDEVCDRLRSDCLGAGQLRARAALKRLEVCHMEVERFPVGRLMGQGLERGRGAGVM